jgi:hypothetical protein
LNPLRQKINSFLHCGYVPNNLDIPFWLKSFQPTQDYLNKSKEELVEIGVDKLYNLIDFSKFSADTHHVLPLSGGLDSRAILGLFLKNGIKNKTTVTFGIPGAMNYEIASILANHFKLQHVTIDLTKIQITRNDLFEIINEGCRWTYLFDAFYNRQIQKHFGKEVVYWSGFMGDNLAGSHLYSIDCINWEKSVKIFSEKQKLIKRLTLTDVEFNINDMFSHTSFYPNYFLSYFDQLDQFYRQKDYIYPTLIDPKYEIKIPFAEKDWLNFILNIPSKYRFRIDLYKEIVSRAFPELFQYPTTEHSGYHLNINPILYKIYRLMEKVKIKRNYTRYNYLDFSENIRSDNQFSDLIKTNLVSLAKRNLKLRYDPIVLFSKNKSKELNCGDILTLLAALELNLSCE